MSTPFTSKLRIAASSLAFVAMSIAASAHAQTAEHEVRVTIPFAFQDGKTHLNPGTYTMDLQSGQFIEVRGPRGNSALLLVTSAETTRPASTGKVVFHKYGDVYFLREIWMSGSSTQLQCPISKSEKSLKRETELSANRPADNGTEVSLLETPR